MGTHMPEPNVHSQQCSFASEWPQKIGVREVVGVDSDSDNDSGGQLWASRDWGCKSASEGSLSLQGS